MELDSLLPRALQLGASDLHRKLGTPPLLRVDGSVEELDDWPVLGERDLEPAVTAVTAAGPRRPALCAETDELDIGHQSNSQPRYPVNAFHRRGAIFLTFGPVAARVPSLGDLRMPVGDDRLADEEGGLVLVTGAPGSDTSTMLAAIVDRIERLRRKTDCIANQREIGHDTQPCVRSPRRTLRQDAEVILVGDLRDAETVETALRAAVADQLVRSTQNTTDATDTIGRIIGFFRAAKQRPIRTALTGILRGVISQRLVPTISGGRIAAVEVITRNYRIAELIRDDRVHDVRAAIVDGGHYGMQTMSQALVDLILPGEITRETAAEAEQERHNFLIEPERSEQELEASGGGITHAATAAPLVRSTALRGSES